MNPDIKTLSINNGLYLGGALALLTVLAYAFNLELFTKWWFGVFILALTIIVGTLSLIKAKQTLGGYITFKDAFTSYFVTVAISLAISGVLNFLLFNFIDPEAASILKERIIETQAESMKKWGATPEAIEKFVTGLEKENNMYSIGNVLQSIVLQIIGYSLVGLLLSAILKKNPEN